MGSVSLANGGPRGEGMAGGGDQEMCAPTQVKLWMQMSAAGDGAAPGLGRGAVTAGTVLGGQSWEPGGFCCFMRPWPGVAPLSPFGIFWPFQNLKIPPDPVSGSRSWPKQRQKKSGFAYPFAG